MSSDRRAWLRLLIMAVATMVAACLGVVYGSTDVGLGALLDALQGEGQAKTIAIVTQLRLPRVLLAIVVGAGLAVSGTAYQSLFRNPLAEPFVIGASSGAALGATIAIVAGMATASTGSISISIAAFAGSLGAVATVYAIGGIDRSSSPLTLLLSGVAVSTILSALVSLLVLIDDRSLQQVYYWILGGLSGHGWADVINATAIIVPGSLAIFALARPMDALLLGDDAAHSIGLSLTKTRGLLVLVATITTAAAVAVSGIIGFVGLMAPHLARMLLGARHSLVVPGGMLLGAALLIVADLVARVALAPVEIPVGIITSLMGGPFFLYVLRSTRPGGDWS